jgi:FkbM family methyltransferase
VVKPAGERIVCGEGNEEDVKPIFSRILESIRVNALAVRNLGFLNTLYFRGQRYRAWMSGATTPFTVRSRHAAHPLWCRPRTTDSKVFYQIFILREYSCLDEISSPGLIIDCGANVGYSSAYFLSRFPEARLIAVEPDVDNATILERNLRPFGERAKIVRSALWSHEAALAIDDDSKGGAWALRVRECRPGEPATVQAITVGAVLKESGEARISILKMDIEGAEAGVFVSDYQEWLNRTDNIVIELHGDESRRVFAAAMAQQPFAIFRHGELTVCKRQPARPATTSGN